MKILAFVDVHGYLPALNALINKTKTQKPELLVCAGDVSIFEHELIGIMRKLDKLNKKIIIVHGNHEDSSTFIRYSKLFRNIVFIHKNYFIEDNILFLGYGGGGFSIEDKEFENIAKKFKKIIKNNKGKKIILVAHAPAYGTKLDKLSGGHYGNKPIRHFVEKNKVDLLVCGHFHENFGKEDNIKKTKIINPGPFGKVLVI